MATKNYVWNGGTGDYSDPNWTDGLGDNGPPTSADDATINASSSIVTADSNDAALDLTVDNAILYVATPSGVLAVGDTLTVGENSTGLSPNSVNSILLVQTGGMVSTQTLVVGDAAGSDGEVDLYAPGASGNTLVADTVDIGVDGTGYLYLYTGGSAQIDYSGGTANAAGTSEIGENSDATGIVNVDDATFDVGGTLNVGDAGYASLSFFDGAAGQLLNVNIGNQTGAIGNLDITDSTVAITGDLAINGGSGISIYQDGSLNAGPTLNDGQIYDDANVPTKPSDVVFGDVSGTGAIDIADSSALELTGSSGSGQIIDFLNNTASPQETLQIDTASVGASGDFESTIAGMLPGDVITLANLLDETGYSFDGTTLTVNFVGDKTATLTLSGVSAQTLFSFVPFKTDGTTTGTSISIVPYIWTGADTSSSSSNTDFSDALNWNPTSGPPGIGDEAEITAANVNTFNNPVIITQATEVYLLLIDDGALNDGALDESGNTLTIDNSLIVGGTSTSSSPNSLVTIGNSATVNAGYVDVGQGTGSNGSVTVGPATLNAANSIVVGDSGTGYLYLDSGAAVSAGTSMSVGLNGVGTLEITDSSATVGANIASGMNVGVDQGSSGTVDLLTGSQLTIFGFLSVGQDGAGLLSIASGSIVNVGPLVPVPPGGGMDLGIGVGDNLGGYGQVTVDGLGSQLNVSREIYVGGPTSNGGNSLSITNGAVVEANLSGDAETENIDALAVAFEPNSNQTVAPNDDVITIDGTGSELNANGTIVVGAGGTGVVNVTNGGELVGQSYPTGVSGLGQASGSNGTINLSAATYSDGDLKVGDGGAGFLYDLNNSTVTLGDNLAIGELSTSSGTVQVGGSVLSGDSVKNSNALASNASDASSLTVGSINVGGDFGGPGGTGNLVVNDDADVSIANYLNVWGSPNGIGTIDLYGLTGGTVTVGSFTAAYPGALVLNPGGQLDLDNGVIEGGVLDLNGGLFPVTPVASQIDDQHSVLQDVAIEGDDLSINGAVLTLAGATSGESGDNVLIGASGSLLDLNGLVGNGDGSSGTESDLNQIIDATDLSLTVADPSLVIDGGPGSQDVFGNPLGTPGTAGEVIGTGAIFSDYSGFSNDIALVNHGLIDAVYNDQLPLDNSAQLSILTNTITDASDGAFEADSGATLSIGNSQVPLDGNHVFTNLQDNGDGTTSLVDGLYNANGGDIAINGNDPNANGDSPAGSPLGPISTLEAVLYLTEFNGVAGDLSVNGASLEDTLTNVTPSADFGEGDLDLNFGSFTFANSIQIQGLLNDEPTGWNIPVSGIYGQGGGLYLYQATFNGPGLTIDAATAGGQAAFIFGDGVINAPVTMDGYVGVWDYSGGTVPGANFLEFVDPVTGSGTYAINGGDTLSFDSTLGHPGDPVTENSISFVTGSGGSSLVIGASDLTDDFRATITDFASSDAINLTNIKGTSAQFNSATDQLDVLNGSTNVATLQLDSTIPTGQQFEVTPYGNNGSTIEFAAPCYCRGTLIHTEHGEMPVENLAIGDVVITTSGTTRPIKWIGRRKVAARFADPLTAWPVRIKAGALGDNVPSRDLLLSPDHAILVDDILIQVGALVNGSSIVRESHVPEFFTYYHIELEDHSLILAESTPAETFVDNIDRMSFDNWAEHQALYPDGNMIAEMPYPRAKSYRQVPRAVRERLAERSTLLYGVRAQAAA
jgi:T5SS/PEP-CTERM-associated repeat protein